MNNESKLMLSDEELQLVNSVDLILTKRRIIEKAMQLFGELSTRMQATIEQEKAWLPAAIVQSSPKIAKGENYLQLPYLLLDYPRCFDADHIFAVRTMFWWGNFFSITVHLSGNYKKMFEQALLDNLHHVSRDIFICIHESPWHHHFEADNYANATMLTANELQSIINNKSFIKLAVKFPLHEWNHAANLLEGSFNSMLAMLKR